MNIAIPCCPDDSHQVSVQSEMSFEEVKDGGILGYQN